jgi:protein TonB
MARIRKQQEISKMKTLLSIVVVLIALALCNLTSKRANRNDNTNSAPPANTAENTNAEAPQPPSTIGSGVPQSSRNQNSAVRVPEAPPPMPGVNQNTARNVPRAPISGGVLNGKAIRLVQPPYPAIAKAAHASGQVTVRVILDENGNVISATPVSGHPLLQASAVAAARASKFSPTLLSGQPVKVTGIVIYNFVLQ